MIRLGREFLRFLRDPKVRRQEPCESRGSSAGFELQGKEEPLPRLLVEAVDRGWLAARGRLLDIGCGSGESAAWLAGRGFRVLGIDVAPGAVSLARDRFGTVPGLDFRVGDICFAHWEDIGVFEALVDHGCFPVLLSRGRARHYVRTAARLLPAGGRLLLLAPPQGKENFQFLSEVRRHFGPCFRLERWEPLELSNRPGLACFLTRTTVVPEQAAHRLNRRLDKLKAQLMRSTPYGVTATWLYLEAWVHRGFKTPRFRRRLTTLRRISSEAGPDAAVESLALSRIAWRVTSFRRLPPQEMTSWVRLSGLDALSRAHARGRGVVLLNSHFGMGRCVPTVLERLGFRGIVSLERRNLGTLQAGEVLELGQGRFFLKQLLTLERTLETGGIIHLAGDGTVGTSLLDLEFLGGTMPMSPAFAKLALDTGAAVLPVFCVCEPRGRLYLEILPPLSPNGSGEQAVRSLLDSYAKILSEKWLERPGNILHHFVHRFLHRADSLRGSR